MSTGFQIVYFSGNDKRKVRGHFDLRNVIQLRPSAEHAAGNGAVELDVAEEGQRKAKLMVISFRGDAAKERAEWLALWCSAVDPSCVSSALQAYADVAVADALNSVYGTQLVGQRSGRSNQSTVAPAGTAWHCVALNTLGA